MALGSSILQRGTFTEETSGMTKETGKGSISTSQLEKSTMGAGKTT